MQHSESIAQIAAALAIAQGQMQNPPKNKEVEVQPKKRDDGSWPPKYKFKYATFDAIIDCARKPLADNGLCFVQTVTIDGGLSLETTLAHSSGEWMRSSLPIRTSDNGPQALGSALTYVKRYALSALLGLAAEEDDDANRDEGNGVDVKRETQTNTRTATVTKGQQRAVETDSQKAAAVDKWWSDFWSADDYSFPHADLQKLDGNMMKAIPRAPSLDCLDKLFDDNSEGFAKLPEPTRKRLSADRASRASSLSESPLDKVA